MVLWVVVIGCVFFIKINAGSTSHAGSAKKKNYFDLISGILDKFLLQQLPQPINTHIFNYQDTDNKLCGVFCLYFYYLIERIDYRKVVSKIYFE